MANNTKTKDLNLKERVENLLKAGTISKATFRSMQIAIKNPLKHPHLVAVLQGIEDAQTV